MHNNLVRGPQDFSSQVDNRARNDGCRARPGRDRLFIQQDQHDGKEPVLDLLGRGLQPEQVGGLLLRHLRKVSRPACKCICAGAPSDMSRVEVVLINEQRPVSPMGPDPRQRGLQVLVSTQGADFIPEGCVNREGDKEIKGFYRNVGVRKISRVAPGDASRTTRSTANSSAKGTVCHWPGQAAKAPHRKFPASSKAATPAPTRRMSG